MVMVTSAGEWHMVTLNHEEIGMFAYRLDAIRFAIAMLHDGLASSVTLQNGATVEP
tara:strand:- start:100 stop:267 length:168 start_codon:yes stop_codon:yes gene_type:complete